MDKGFLKEKWDSFVTWQKVTFPSQETLEELDKRGWGQKTICPLNIYTGFGAAYPIQYPVTPEGEDALPGTAEYKRYLDTVRDIVAKQDAKANTPPSP